MCTRLCSAWVCSACIGISKHALVMYLPIFISSASLASLSICQTSITWMIIGLYFIYKDCETGVPMIWFVISSIPTLHDDVIKSKHFPRYLTFVRGIHRSPHPHKGQWRGALKSFLTCVWINGWVNNREAGDLRRYHAHNNVIVMIRLKAKQRKYQLF